MTEAAVVAIPCSRYLPYRHDMSWLPLFGTVVRAAIALSSALLVERRRERRQDHLDRRVTKQDLYARCLAAHAHMPARLRILAATSGLSDEERANRARTAYTSCFAPRYALEVLAPQSVLSSALGPHVSASRTTGCSVLLFTDNNCPVPDKCGQGEALARAQRRRTRCCPRDHCGTV